MDPPQSTTTTATADFPHPKTVAILGAGITGLQTALSILLSSSPSSPLPPPHVLILATHLPGDLSLDYTSPWAGAHWRSHAPSSAPELQAWDARTYREWRRLLAGETQTETQTQTQMREAAERKLGLGVRESVLLWKKETEETRGERGEGLWWRDMVEGFRVLAEEELAAVEEAASSGTQEGEGRRERVVFGVRYDSVCINVPRYLNYLRESIVALGGVFIRATVKTDGGVEGVVEGVLGAVAAAVCGNAGVGREDVEAVVLATGLMSRLYVEPEEAARMYAVRGQTVLVKGEAERATTLLLKGEGQIVYVIPRPGSGTTILGGSKDVRRWDEEEDRNLTVRILERARGLAPELLSGEGVVERERGKNAKGEFEVLSVQVGLRPGRESGPRVEMGKKRIRGVRVIYAYGHEGAGYQNSVGSAEKVVKLLAEI